MTGRARAVLFSSIALGAAVAGFAVARIPEDRTPVSSWIAELRRPDLSAFAAPLEAAAAEFRIEPALLKGMVAAESGGRPAVTSHAGAVGLLQLVPATAKEQAQALGLDPETIDLEDPATNLRLGARYFARLLTLQGGSVELALAAYNAGPEHVRRWRARAVDADGAEVVRREGFAETRNHVTRTLRYRDGYR